MPREARRKTNESIYHIMVRSIKEINLFSDSEDKMKYFQLIKQNKIKFNFKVYAYCLMDNHGHLIIDANGADISTIMHSINFCYARYYNLKHDRYGHVFQDRFKSKIVDTEAYMIRLSAYIHNNAKDIPGYKNNIINYKYSSLKNYIENSLDEFEILDKTFLTNVMGLYNDKCKDKYIDLVNESDSIKEDQEEFDVEFSMSHAEYRSERKILARNYSANKIINYIISYTNENKKQIYIKYSRTAKETRALCAFFMRCFCNFTQKEICNVIGNVTGARVSELCKIGYELVLNNFKYNKMFDSFIV